MENIILTQLSITEVRSIFRQELENFFHAHPQPNYPEKETSALLTVQQAAKFLNLAVPTLYNMVSRKEIPFNKPAGTRRLYFLQQDLEDWVKSGRRKTVAEIKAETFYLPTKKKGGI
jgi:excisionase family DNA binding protein